MKSIILNENSNIVISEDTQIIIKENTQVDLWIEYTSNAKVDIFVERNASLNVVHHYTLDSLVEQLTYHLKEASQSNIVFTALKPMHISQEINIDLIGEHAKVEVRSGILVKENNKINIAINHKAKNTYGNMEHYAVVHSNAKLSLYGVGKIFEKMSGSAAHQTTRVLTMAKDHECEVTPVLIIDENDVSASHANSIGQPDDLQLYYLQSRGLSIEQSLNLISAGYLEPMVILLEETSLNEKLKDVLESETTC